LDQVKEASLNFQPTTLLSLSDAIGWPKDYTQGLLLSLTVHGQRHGKIRAFFICDKHNDINRKEKQFLSRQTFEFYNILSD
jgi:hypothetical protein